MDVMTTQNWTHTQDEFNIAWLTLDRKDAGVNTLSREVLEELSTILNALQTKTLPLGLIIRSGKAKSFIAGADVRQFAGLNTVEAALDFIQLGQKVFKQLASLPIPTVALIEGDCLGGGLELALACRYRVVAQDAPLKLGLPEVMLGIHPGWGGTVRLPRLIGGLKAMQLILTGKLISGGEAKAIGLVDALAPVRQCTIAARYFVQKSPSSRVASFWESLTNQTLVRSLLGKYLRKKLSARINPPHYPAPYAALEQWVVGSEHEDAAFAREASSIAKLIVTDTARHLLRVFHLREKLKRLGREVKFTPSHVHVEGAGVMGGDIAAWCALKGLQVTLHDQNLKAVASALNRAVTLFKKHLREPHLIKAAMDRLMPDATGMGIRKADLIIEAIVEKAAIKKEFFLKLAAEARPDAIFATNTSTIPLKEFSDDLSVRKRLIGLHFFNPVAKMPLVEVISSEDSDPLCVKKGMALVRLIEKLPLPVKSSPGFLVNRILMPYVLEGILLLEAGVAAPAIDQAVVDFGMPMGPIELADAVGLDVCLYAGESLAQYYGHTIPRSLTQLVQQGHLGRKSGQGFYQYKKDKKLWPGVRLNVSLPEDTVDRLLGCMLNEAVACLREGIVTDKDYVDAGMIFGAGFPPFRGGPMQYIADEGESLLAQRLNLLSQRYGERFLPDAGWADLANL